MQSSCYIASDKWAERSSKNREMKEQKATASSEWLDWCYQLYIQCLHWGRRRAWRNIGLSPLRSSMLISKLFRLSWRVTSNPSDTNSDSIACASTSVPIRSLCSTTIILYHYYTCAKFSKHYYWVECSVICLFCKSVMLGSYQWVGRTAHCWWWHICLVARAKNCTILTEWAHSTRHRLFSRPIYLPK